MKILTHITLVAIATVVSTNGQGTVPGAATRHLGGQFGGGAGFRPGFGVGFGGRPGFGVGIGGRPEFGIGGTGGGFGGRPGFIGGFGGRPTFGVWFRPGFGGLGGFGYRPGRGRSSDSDDGATVLSGCRYWCSNTDGQPYCCETAHEPQTPVTTKPGQCPPVRTTCPAGGPVLGVGSCSNDGSCGIVDKCCFDTCLQQNVCKPPTSR